MIYMLLEWQWQLQTQSMAAAFASSTPSLRLVITTLALGSIQHYYCL